MHQNLQLQRGVGFMEKFKIIVTGKDNGEMQGKVVFSNNIIEFKSILEMIGIIENQTEKKYA